MVETAERGVTIDQCVSCGFLWFDQDEITQYMRGQHRRPTFKVPDDAMFKLASSTSSQLCTRCNELTLQSGSVFGRSFLWCSACEGLGISDSNVRAIRKDAIKQSTSSPALPSQSENALPFAIEVVLTILFGG
jgi:Zn-finger nucleic acid-binding protein